MDWGKEVEDSESGYTRHLRDVIERPKEIKQEKQGISEVAVKKNLPYGITRKIGQFIGKSSGGKKRKVRRGGKKKTHRRRK